MMPPTTSFLATLCVLTAPTLGLAQNAEPTPVFAGEQLTIYSDILGEDRPVLIYTPDGSDQTSTAYPVLYLLDGNSHFLHTAGIIQFLSNVGYMSPMIVVALPNTAGNRGRDLTPPLSTPDENRPLAGGADRFLAFIADELIPYMETNYRTAPYRVLVGHSLGGLFAVHALLTRPDVFNSYVAISPSLWWDDKALLPKAEAFFTEHQDLRGSLYMTIGDEGGAMLAAAWGLAGVLEEHAPDGFAWHFDHMEKETHGSIPHRTTYDALERLYTDWRIANPGLAFDEGGLEALDTHFAYLSEQFGYEIITPEAMVNTMGYRLIGQDKPDRAIMVFQRNVDVYPTSVNVYDSLGDAYDAAGRIDDAKANYEKACTMGRATSHINTATYCANLERVSSK